MIVPPVIAPKPAEWPRPTEVPCQCGGTAFQRAKGATSYGCVRCGTITTAWTGFDDPAWF